MAVETPTASARSPYAGRSPYPLVVGGEELERDESFAAFEPSTGREWARITQAAAKDVDAAITAADRAFREWRLTTLERRQELLWRIADLIEAEAPRWRRLLPTENGRPVREVDFADVPAAAGIFRYFSGAVRDLGGTTFPVADAAHVFTTREPLGPVATLIPWNSPLITTANKLAPALAAGNTVVMKPSEFASASVVELALLLQDLLPPGVVNVVTGYGPDVGAALVGDPRVAKVSFTGGTETGRRIMAAAGAELTPALMELGGKGALVVCDDADLDAAVQDALTGIFIASGQVCFASARLLVHADVHGAFVDRLVDAASRVRVGDALDPETQMGPLVTAAHRDLVLARVERARSEGAEALLGGSALELPGELAGGYFIAPTVFVDATGTTSVSREEVFGPVVVVERWTDEAEALARANATDYGLGAGVWTADLQRAHRFARGLDAGIVWVNKWFDTPAGTPMGGVKASGFGRELWKETLHEYTSVKVVNVGLSTDRPPLWG